MKINLAKHLTKTLRMRVTAINFFKSLEKTGPVIVLDFADIDFVSRSFADQMILEKEKLAKRNVTVKFVKLNKDVDKIFDIVIRSRSSERTYTPPRLKKIPFKSMSQFSSALKSA